MPLPAPAARTRCCCRSRLLDLRPGDEVITTPFTFFATAGAIHNAGGTPVFVDINPDTFNIAPAAVEAAITPRTRGIVAVHLFGQMAAGRAPRAAGQPAGRRVDRGRGPVDRRAAEGRWRVAGRGRDGHGRDPVLLPQQEPRRVRRRRHDGYPGRRPSRPAASPSAPRWEQAVLPRRGRVQQPPRHAARGSAPGQAPASRRLERRPRAPRCALQRGVRGPSGHLPTPDRSGQRAHLQPVHPPGASPRRAAGAPQGEGDRAIRSIIRSRCTSSRASLISPTPRGVFRLARPPSEQVLSLPVYPELRRRSNRR